MRVKQALGHLEAIHRLADVAARATDPEPIHREALDVLIDAVGADRAAVLLLDAGEDGLHGPNPADAGMRFVAWRGLSDGYRAAVGGHSPWPPDAVDAQPVLVPDVVAEPSLAPLLDALRAEGIAAVGFFPMVSGGRLLGKFVLYFDQPHLFGTDEVELARTVAAQVAFAIARHTLEAELRTANAALAATLDAVTDGITVQSPDGRLLFANDDAALTLGYASPADLIAAGVSAVMEHFEVLDENGDPLDLSQLPGRQALLGHEPPERLIRYRIAGRPEDRWSVVSARPVLDDEGTVRFAVNVFRDVTERQRSLQALHESQRRLSILSATSRRLLDLPLDYATILSRVPDLFVPDMADVCSVREVPADGGDVARVVVRRTDGIEPGAAEKLLASPDAVVAPLQARGRTFGEVRVATSDRELVEEVGRRAALALEHALVYEERSTVAATLQRALLPPQLPAIPGIELAARYSTATSDVGGDFYDVVQIGPARWLVAVGDVCGKGIAAASLTPMVRYTMRAFAADTPSPSNLLSRLNEALLDHLDPERFCTLACGFLDVAGDTTTLTISLGGHPRPLLVSPAGGGNVRPVGIPGTLLGSLPWPTLSDQTVTLTPGDALVVFTDGCVGDDPVGAERQLIATLEREAGGSAARLAEAVEQAARAAVRHTDDLTVLSCRRVGG
ncbi:MAG TPA: SpoIIE family protein phosphatase [Acidimicrobiales bacterium]